MVQQLGPTDLSLMHAMLMMFGATVATVIWVIASVGFSLYVENFGSYSKTYGALAGVAILMLWLWITAFIVLLGAEINAERIPA